MHCARVLAWTGHGGLHAVFHMSTQDLFTCWCSCCQTAFQKRSLRFPSMSIEQKEFQRKVTLGQRNTGLFFFFFFLMWIIFKIFIAFVTIVFLFCVLVCWPQGTWELSSLTRDQTCTPALDDQVLITGPSDMSPRLIFLLIQEGLWPKCFVILF